MNTLTAPALLMLLTLAVAALGTQYIVAGFVAQFAARRHARNANEFEIFCTQQRIQSAKNRRLARVAHIESLLGDRTVQALPLAAKLAPEVATLVVPRPVFERELPESKKRKRQAKAATQPVSKVASKPAVVEESVDYPATFSEMPAWSLARHDGRLVLLPSALRSLEAARYQDVKLVYQALDALAFGYCDMKRDGGVELLAQHNQRLAELRLTDKVLRSKNRNCKSAASQYFTLDGRTVLTERHLCKGAAMDERFCFRLYYTFDAETRQVLVGHLPSHLPNAVSN